MKISQERKHLVASLLLQTPGIDRLARWRLTRNHVTTFLDLSPPGQRAERRDHFRVFFDAAFDAYFAALDEGYSEAQAREITHILANLDFHQHGWTELMGFPATELEPHYERYGDFFERHDIDFDDPLGEFTPPDGLPDAPATPDKLTDPTYERATGGYADDLYVEAPDLSARRSQSG